MTTSRRTSETGHRKTSDALSYEMNDSLSVLKEPRPPLMPTMDILFFHGFHSSDSSDSHLRTWEIQLEDGPCIWPSSWLVERFPNARILYVSYNAILGKISHGKPDLYVIGENLASDLMQANIGQTPNCAVILVGHCFGGIVIKHLCLHIKTQVGLAREDKRKKLENFLSRIKGVFYYGTPHRGSSCVDNATNLHGEPLLKYFQLLSTEASRMNSEFAHLCNNVYREWRIEGLGESLPTNQGLFQGVVVAPEASSRDGDQYNVVAADHVSITKPERKTDRRFNALTSLLHGVVYSTKVEVLGHQCEGLPDYLPELENQAREVEDKLKDLSILGIFGMGGIGKTTLAKQVYNNISKEFEYTCFCDNVKGIEKGLADWVCTNFYRSGNNIDKIQWADLKRKKTLIVMDDVDAEAQLAVLPKLNHFKSGSKIIITSRDKEIYRFYDNCGMYEIDLLTTNVARKLFCRHAFDQEDIPGPIKTKKLEGQVTKVVEKCDGLPLTLEVIGRYLRGRTANADIWKETILKLGKAQAVNGAQNDRVWASLKVSYNALAEEEKEMFLEAGTIFFGKPLDLALAAWSIGIGESETRWANLVSRSMVKEGFGRKSGSNSAVWVHEHLRDLAKSLATGPVISGTFAEDELLEILDSKEVKEETKAVWLDRHSTTLQLDLLATLENLKYLYLPRLQRYEGSGNIGKNWPRRLSMLRWENEKSLSKRPLFPFSLSELKNLAVLDLCGWEIPELSKSLGYLTNLRILNLTELRGLDSLPENLGNFTQLKELNLQDVGLLKLPESLGQLSALEVLTLSHLQCSQLPESIGNLKSLKHVLIEKCPGLECLPRSFSELWGLEALVINDCGCLKELGDSFEDLPALRSLTLSRCGIERLPERFGHLSALEELSLWEIDVLTRLPDNIGQLTSLQRLKIRCKNLKALPDSLEDLARLKDMFLRVNRVKALPDSFWKHCSVLEKLSIEADNMKSLPTSIERLSSLQSLCIESSHLEKLPDFGGLLSLKELRINASRLENLPESMGQLQSMQKLVLSMRSMKTLPKSLGQILSLKSFEFDCNGIEQLPRNFDHLPFSSLALTLNFDRGVRLPDGVGDLSTLRDLTLHSFRFESLSDELGKLSSLRRLKFRFCRLKSLPESLGCISSLTKMELSCCHELKTLPDTLGRPWVCPVAPSQEERTKESIVENAYSHATDTKGLRLVINKCEYLDESRMRNFGWVHEGAKDAKRKVYRRENAFPSAS